MEHLIMPAKPNTPAGLTAGLVARKGQAAPTSPHVAAQAASHKPVGKGERLVYYKALTLKLDKARYQALKQLGLQEDKSSQELLTEAVDALLHGQVSGAR